MKGIQGKECWEGGAETVEGVEILQQMRVADIETNLLRVVLNSLKIQDSGFPATLDELLYEFLVLFESFVCTNPSPNDNSLFNIIF